MYPNSINGIDPTIISKSIFLLLCRFSRSFLKKKIIANKDPRCKLTSINNELDWNSYIDETIIRCEDELIGKNSDIPWTSDRIIISIKFEDIFSLVT